MDISNMLLNQFTFLNSMENSLFKEMLNNISVLSIKKGKILIQDDGRCVGVPMILKGTIRLYKLSREGREITLFNMEEGEICFLAAACIIGELEYGFFVEAVTDGQLAIISADFFINLFHKSKIWQKKIFEVMAARLIDTMNVVEAVTFTSIEMRVANYLINKYRQGKSKIIKSTHENISKEIGTAREVVSRQLKDFEKKDLIILKRSRIEIINLKGLEKIINV